MSPIVLVVVGLGLPFGGWLFARFVRWEREGRRHLVLGVLVAAVLFEALFAGLTSNVPISLFRPAVAGQDFRLPDPLLLLALSARVVVAPVPRIVRGMWAACVLLLVWLGWCTLVGLQNGSAFAETVFDLKSYLYIVGTMVLVAGVPIQEILQRQRFSRWLLVLTVVSAVMIAMQVARTIVTIPLPGLPIVLGQVGAETNSVLVAIGAVAFCLEACSPRPRVVVVVSSLLLLISPFSGGQRASFVQLGLTVLCLVPFMVTATWVRRVRFNPTDALIFLFGFLIAGGLVLGLSGELPSVTQQFQETFDAPVKAATASVRVKIFETSKARIAERPLFGWGMGDRVSQRFSGILGLGQTEQITSHNILVDLALRTGLVGVVLGLVVLGWPVVAGLRVWLFGTDNRVAGAVLGAIAGIVGLLGKGMVETIFEKFRIGIVLGFLLGLLASAATDWRQRSAQADRADEVAIRATEADLR
jgi:hypothetical protein